MMCLGWSTQPSCSARPTVDLAPASCPSIAWFWIALAAVVGVSAVKKD